MTKFKMAIDCVVMPSNQRANFKSFAELIVVLLVLIELSIVAGTSQNYIEHHHNNHVCNHQHPKAHDVRQASPLGLCKLFTSFSFVLLCVFFVAVLRGMLLGRCIRALSLVQLDLVFFLFLACDLIRNEMNWIGFDCATEIRVNHVCACFVCVVYCMDLCTCD